MTLTQEFARVTQSRTFEGPARLHAKVRYGIDLHWLRNCLPQSGDFAAPAGEWATASLAVTLDGPFRFVVAIEEGGRLRLRMFGANGAGARVSVTASGEPGAAARDDLTRALNGRSQGDAAGAAAFAERCFAKALDALERKYAAEIARQCRQAADLIPLVDCSFEPTTEGLALYRRALCGEFDALTDHAGALPHAMRQERRVELYAPAFSRADWGARWQLLAQAEIECSGGGRLFAHVSAPEDADEARHARESSAALAEGLGAAPANSTFSFTYSARLDPRHAAALLAPVLDAYEFDGAATAWIKDAGAEEIEASVLLEIPGAALSAWLRSPSEGAPEFSPAFVRVSRAMQRALRLWLPFAFFSQGPAYERPVTALPLLFYRSLKPFRSKARTELTYDLVDGQSEALRRPGSVWAFAAELKRVQRELTAAGQGAMAARYEHSEARAVLARFRRRPRRLNLLLTAETFFINSLMNFAVQCRELPGVLAHDPAAAVRRAASLASDLAETIHRRLRHSYEGSDFSPMGALLMMEATRVLGAALGEETRVRGVMRLRIRRPGEVVEERTFVNGV